MERVTDTPVSSTYSTWTVDEVLEWTCTELDILNGYEFKERDNEATRSDHIDHLKGDTPSLPVIIQKEQEEKVEASPECNVRKQLYMEIKSKFEDNNITGDVLPYLSFHDCMELLSGDLKLAIKFRICINKLKNASSDTASRDNEIITTLNNLHNTVSEKLQEYQAQYARLRLYVLEVMKRSTTASAASAAATHPQQSVPQQDYFERTHHGHHSSHPSPASPRNHAGLGTAQRRTSFGNLPNVAMTGSSNTTPPVPGSSTNTNVGTPPHQLPATNEPLKQLRASKEDSTEKILKNAMKKHNLNEANWRQYVLVICYGDQERILEMDEQPVVIFKNLKQQGLHPAIMLRQKGDFEEVGDLTPGGRL